MERMELTSQSWHKTAVHSQNMSIIGSLSSLSRTLMGLPNVGCFMLARFPNVGGENDANEVKLNTFGP